MGHYQKSFAGTCGADLSYQAWHPDAPPKAAVIGIHGLGDHSVGLKNIVEHLLGFNYAWYGMDLRGHGLSAGRRGHIDSWSHFLDDLSLFINMVKEKERGLPLFLLGHSMGGLIALEFAIRGPDEISGLIAISPALDFNGISLFARTVINVVSVVHPLHATPVKSAPGELTRDPAIAARLLGDPLRHNELTAGLLREMAHSQLRVNKNGHAIKTPVMMLHGRSDTITRSGKTRRLFESITHTKKEYHDIEDLQHRPFDDLGRDQVLHHIASWLDRQIAAQPCKFDSRE